MVKGLLTLKQKMVDKNKNSKAPAALMGLGILAASFAGAYYLYGTKDGAKKKAKIKGWMLKAKGEVLEKLENLKDVNEGSYYDLVSGVMKKYEAVKSIDKVELEKLGADLKKHWKNIKKHMDDGSKKPVKKIKKS